MRELPSIREYMEKIPVTLHVDTNVYDAIEILLDKGVTSVAVVDNDKKLAGILSEKDCLHTLVHEVYEGLPGKSVSEYMTKKENIVSIHPDTDVFYAASIFLRNNFRRLLILEDEMLVGQITRRDLLRVIQKLRQNQGAYNPITGKREAKDPKLASSKFFQM